MLRSVCLWALGAVPAQESRPVAEPFVRVVPDAPGTPWPRTQDALWVVTADPFLFSASAAYFQDTLESMALLLRILSETRDCLGRSDWARARPEAWQRLRAPIQDVIDAWEKDEEAGQKLDTDREQSWHRALRRLTAQPEWQEPPFPPEALDQGTRTRWLQFRDLVTALWGDTRTGSDGWFLRAAADSKGGKRAVAADPLGLLPRVADLLGGAAEDPEFAGLAQAPGVGTGGVFTTPERTRTFLLRALRRLETDRPQPPSVRDALYRCLACLLEEPEQMRELATQEAEAPGAGVLRSMEWRELRTESGAGLITRVRHADHQSVVRGRVVGRPADPKTCKVVVLISPAMRAALTELETAWARAELAWNACTGRRPDDYSIPHLQGFSTGLIRDLLALDPRAANGDVIVLGKPHAALIEQLTRWGPATGRFYSAFMTSLADPESGREIPKGSWLRQRLQARHLQPVEFRLRIEGAWRWGRGAVAGCAMMTEDQATPLRTVWLRMSGGANPR